MRALLAYLVSVSLVQAQLQGCPLPDAATLQRLVTQLRGGGTNVSAPAYKCQATGGSQGAYSFFSAVLKYTRSGIQEAAQFDASCPDGETWTGISASVINDPADPVFGAQLKTSCLQCVKPNSSNVLLQSLDNVTHCLPCPNSCKGLAQCYYTYGAAQCCNYLSRDGTCVVECPSSFLPNKNFICSTVLGFSSNAETIYRSELPYRFTIYTSAPVSYTVLEITGGTNNVTVNVAASAVLIQYEADIEDDHIALKDPTTYTLTLYATSSLVPLVCGGQVGAVTYYPNKGVTIGFQSPNTAINWDVAIVTVKSSVQIARPLPLQLYSTTGINLNVTLPCNDSTVGIQFSIPLGYDDIVTLEGGSGLTIYLGLGTPYLPYVWIGGEGLYASTELIADNEDVTIGFNTSAIVAKEGDGFFTVTIIRANTTLVRPIAVLLRGDPGPLPNTSVTAAGVFNTSLTFDNNTSTITITIPIKDDHIALETDEIYNLTLAVVNPDPRVHLDPAYLTVTIKDGNVVYVSMATRYLSTIDKALVLPVCVNRSGAVSLAQPLPFVIKITGIQANHTTITEQFVGHFEPNDLSTMVCVSIPNFSSNGGLVATLTLLAPITRGVSLLPDSTATIINFTSAESVSSVQPLTSSVQPLASSVQPLTSSVQPLASSVQPLASSVQPLVTSVRPLTSSVQPLTSSVQPLVSSVRPLTSSVQPLTSSVQPLVSSVQPLTSSVRPLTSSVQPLTSSVQPLASSVRLLVTSVQPLTSSVQPLTSSVQPLVSSVRPLTSSVQPLVSSVQPLTSSVQPLVSRVQPLASSVRPLASSVQPSVHIPMMPTISTPTLRSTPSITQQLVQPSSTSLSSHLSASRLAQPSASPPPSQPPPPTNPTATPHPLIPLLVNDTMVADPLFTVPLMLPPGEDPLLLCYEIHGQPGQYYNLISDTCTYVNAFYVGQGTLNVIDAIGITTVDDAGNCVQIKVNLSASCMPYVEGVQRAQYGAYGVGVAKYRQKVRISVTNCKVQPLVMWVTCVEDSSYQTLQFTVTRGLNLSPTSHGLIGQFWSVPVTKQLYQDPNLPGDQEFQPYLLTVYHPNATPRSFVASQYSQTWDRTPTPCYYAGSSQGGLDGASHDSVIEGRYSDYKVTSLESYTFKYSRFNQTICATSP